MQCASELKTRSGWRWASSAILRSFVETVAGRRVPDVLRHAGSAVWPPLSSGGSVWRTFPTLIGTMGDSDFPALFSRRFVSFTSQYPSRVLCFCPAPIRTRPRRPGPSIGGPLRSDGKNRDLPGSWGTLADVPWSLTPPRLRHQAIVAPSFCLPPTQQRRPADLILIEAAPQGPPRPLSTLRSRSHPRTTQDSLPAGGQPLPDGFGTRRVPSKGFRRYIASSSPKLCLAH